MNEINYQEILQKEYLEKIYGWAVNKVGDYDQAEELAQEVVVELYMALARKPKIDNFPAWVWSIAKYTYYRWLRKWNPNLSLETVIGIDGRDVDASLLEAEELQLLRRELSFLSDSLRQTIVYYYFYGKSCDEIANLLGVSPGTVKWRLFEARNQLRRGMEEMRRFGERCFNPGRLTICINGCSGNDRSPFSSAHRRIPQNILLTAYEQPKTVEELAEELGISRPYLEEEVRLLLDTELLREAGSDKVQTNFVIMNQNTILSVIKSISDYADPVIQRWLAWLAENQARISAFLDSIEYLSWERMLWVLIPICMRTLHIKFMNEYSEWYSWNDLPIRPNGGRWVALGTDLGDHSDQSPWSEEDNFLLASWAANGPVQTMYDGIKMLWMGTSLTEINACVHHQLNKTDYQMCWRIARKDLSFDALTDAEKEALAKGIELGYIVKDAEAFRLAFPCFSTEQSDALENLALELYDAVIDMYRAMYQKTRQVLLRTIPKYLHNEMDTAATGTLLFGVVPAALTKAYRTGMLSKIDEKTKQYLCTWMIA